MSSDMALNRLARVHLGLERPDKQDLFIELPP